jgi:hypothetical protein
MLSKGGLKLSRCNWQVLTTANPRARDISVPAVFEVADSIGDAVS